MILKSRGLEWKRVLKQMYRNVRWMDDDVQDVQETGHKRTSSARFMLLLDCAAGHASGNPKTAEIEHLLVPGIVPGSLVGIKDIDSLEPEAEAL